MKIVATIEARMKSSRLPGKILKPIVGKSMLELLIERLSRVRQIDGIVVATTDDAADDVVEDLTRRIGVSCFRGSEDDVLGRVLKAARSVQADVIVEITGDCPLVDPDVIDRIISTYLSGDYDYVSNTLNRTYPRGLDAQVFATTVLSEVDQLTQDPADREHVSLYIYEHEERFTLFNVESGLPKKYWDLRLTVDTSEDMTLITTIYKMLYADNPAFTLRDVLNLFDRQPELAGINQTIEQKPIR